MKLLSLYQAVQGMFHFLTSSDMSFLVGKLINNVTPKRVINHV